MIGLLRKSLGLLASLKVAIPLLVLLTAATIVGSLFPTPDFFRSNAYLGLLGVLGLSLLLITIKHAPLILRRKGRNAMIGVITTHLGILVVIGGVIYGGYTGFRHAVRLVEGEVTVVPGLPFAIQLDELLVEEYRQEEFPRMNLAALPKKQQDSRITLLRAGKPWLTAVAAPGSPVKADGVTILPAISDVGWVFDLIVVDPLGREKTVPIRPWAPPLVTLGDRQVMTHGITDGNIDEAGVFTLDGQEMVELGVLRAGESLEIDRYELSLGPVRRYTGVQVYDRPQESILVWGSVLMFAGLVWHFYFRHRDRRREGQADA